jgi:hypothetical protein
MVSILCKTTFESMATPTFISLNLFLFCLYFLPQGISDSIKLILTKPNFSNDSFILSLSIFIISGFNLIT